MMDYQGSYDPRSGIVLRNEQERDDHGRFAGGGGDSKSGGDKTPTDKKYGSLIAKDAKLPEGTKVNVKGTQAGSGKATWTPATVVKAESQTFEGKSMAGHTVTHEGSGKQEWVPNGSIRQP